MKHLAQLSLTTVLLSTGHALAQPTIEQAFSGEMLGVNLRYFESTIGPARESWGDEHHYRIDGCNLSVTAPAGKISALSLELSDKCSANLNSFLGPDYATQQKAPQVLADFQRNIPDLTFYSDCLRGCGNAADPSVQAFWEGGRAQEFTEIMLEMVQISDATIAAANQWETWLVKNKGDDFVDNLRFNCEGEQAINQVANQVFAQAPVNRITIGYELRKPTCY